MSSNSLRDMLVKQEPRPMITCFVCSGPRAEYTIFSKPNGNHPFFPFLEHHQPPEDAQSIGPDGNVQVCLVCYSFLTQQWDSYERSKTPQSKRIYWLKRLDNGPFAGMEQNLQQDYESLFENSHVGDHEQHERTKRVRNVPSAGTELPKSNVRFYEQTESRDSSSCSFQSRSENVEGEPDNPANNVLDLSMPSRTPSQSSAAVAPSAINEVCFVCGQESKNTFNIFAKAIANCPYFPSLLYHQKPPNAKPMDSSGKVFACEHCHRSLLQQWDYYQRHHVPHHDRAYQLKPPSATTLPTKKEPSAHENTFVCFTCGMMTSSTAQRTVYSQPQKEGEPYFSFLQHISPHPGASVPVNGKVCVCSVCYKSLFRQLRVFELSGIPEERRKYKILNETLPEEFSVLRQHLKTGDAHPKYLPPSECYTCGKQMDASYSLDTVPQNGMYFPFVRSLVKPPHAKPIDHLGQVKVCGQCHTSLRYQWEAFELNHIPVAQRQYRVQNHNIESNSTQHSASSNRISPATHVLAHRDEQMSKKNVRSDICIICERLLTADNVHVLDTLPQKEGMHFPFIRGLIRPENEKFVDQFGRVLACSQCHITLKNQWDVFESARVPHSQRQYKVLTPNNEKEGHLSGNVLVRNASAALHVQVSSPDFRIDLNKFQTNMEPLLTTVSTLPMPNVITSNAQMPSAVLTSHSPHNNEFKLSQVKLPSKALSEDFGGALRISGPLDVPYSRPLLAIATTCFVCGEYSPSGHIYAVRSTPLTSANASDKVPENNRIPYFPFLSKHVPLENAEKLMEDGNALVCTFCYHSLTSQWLAYETSPHPEDSNPWHRKYNTYHYVCYICGITTYRKRVYSISVRDFPFLVEHNRPPGALTLHNGESVVTCLTCFESVTSQWKDFERMKVPLEMRKYNWIVTPPPPDDEQSRSCQSMSGQDSSSSVPYVSISSEEHAQFEQRPSSNYEDRSLPHGSKPPPPPHLGMQPPYVSSKPVNRSIAAVSPLHQVPSHPNSVFSPFNTGSSAALSATRTSSFAAALRKLAKQAVDPVAEKELSPISPVPSPALSQRSNTPKRHMPPSAFLNNLSQSTVPVGSPPLVTMAPNHSNLSHTSDKRKSLEMARYSSSGSNSSSLSAEPVSLKMDSKSSLSEKRNDHILGTKPMSSTHQQISTVSGIPTSHPESGVSSRGFQPYRSSEEVHHSLPNHAYEPPPSANVGGYPYPSAFMPTSHLTHPAYRLDESLYLERYGLLRPPIMPFPSSAGMLPHPSVPLYPGSRYPPELLTQPVGLVSPRSSAFNQERLKQEEGRLKDNVASHEREIYQEHERERDMYQDREREREIEESARSERNHATHSPASFNVSSRGGSPGHQGSITQGTPRELAARKPSSPVSSSPLNLATHSSQMLFKTSRPKESDLWYTRQPNISNGQDHESSPYKGDHDSTAGLRQPPPPLTVSSQVQHQPQMKLSAPNLEKNSSSVIYSKSAIHPHGRDYQKLSSSDAFHDSPPNVHINGVMPREKHLYNSYPVWDNHQTNTEKQSTNTSSEFPFKNSFDVKNGAIHSQDEWQSDVLHCSDRPPRYSQHEVNQEVPKTSAPVVNSASYLHTTEESRYHQFQSGAKETSLTRALLQNHITPSFVEDLFYANREQTCNVISKLDLKEARIKNIRLNGNFGEGEEDIDSESDTEDGAKLHCFLFIRKGPALKLDTSKEKLNFLKSCGLTTHNKKRAVELRKLLKRRRLFRERSLSPLVKELKLEEPSPSLTDTQNLSELSKRLCLDENLETRAEFLKMLGLVKATPEEKLERERCWRAIEKDRARRNGLLGSSEHCVDLPVRRCRNNVRSILNGLKRHAAKNSQIGKNENKHPNGMFPSPVLLSNTDSSRKGNNRESSVRVLSSFLKPPSKTITTPVPPLIPTPKASRASPSVTEQKETRPVVVLSQDPRVRQLKDFAQEFHESVLQTTQKQLEKRTAQSSQILDSTLLKISPPATEPSGKGEKEALSPRKIFRWPGIEAIMESYESHVTDQNAEKDFLTERCQKLRITTQEHNKQIECLGQRKNELLQVKEQLEAERQNLQSTIDSLKSFFQHFR